MHITDLTLRQFRSYEHLNLPELGRLVIFCGPNAAGKTNILEGIHLLTTGNSFRHAQIQQMIRRGGDHAHLMTHMTDGNRQLTCELALEPGKKRFSVNGKARPAADVRGTLPAVSFVPDDLNLAKKSSGIKRDALDALGVQLSKNYGIVLRDYEKAIRYKNRLLKEEASDGLVEAINETLLAVSSQLYCYRRSLYERMVPLVQASYQRLASSSEEFSGTYTPSWARLANARGMEGELADAIDAQLGKEKVRTYIYDAFRMFGAEERRAHRTLVGPHHDQIAFFLDGGDASLYASQGQQRSIVLAWKLAEVELVRRSLNVNPVLLLDDVMSELDEQRRAHLVKTVTSDIQTFVTTTDLTPFSPDLLDNSQIINV